MHSYPSVGDFLKLESPAEPVICHRPAAVTRAAKLFLEQFPGDVLYAVKANPSPVILDALYAAGIRSFDVASLAEVALLSAYPDAVLYCMNPVKHPAHIRSAYFDHGVRRFSLDTHDELDKILAATGFADDLHLYVRLDVDNSQSVMPLDKKFGVKRNVAPALLAAARTHAEYLGVCFHVGSQSMDPMSYVRAMARVNKVIASSGVVIDALDVGGGFPAAYPGIEPVPMQDYFGAIRGAFEESLTTYTCTLMCEPGRALVAEGASLLVNVTLRKGQLLYINDGAYGALYDAAHSAFPYPVRLWRDGRPYEVARTAAYSFYGPTCDSADFMPGPFVLPADVRAGDFIEIGQLGAYGDSLRTDFNGFGQRSEIILTDTAFQSVRDEVEFEEPGQRRFRNSALLEDE